MTDAFDADRMTPGPRATRLAEMLRVDHAGEHGAVEIYRGQRAVFDALRGKTELTQTLKAMEESEALHLTTFNKLLAERGVRPTLMSPIWSLAGFGLGAATALMGEKAAMACTAAVEEVIEQHYAKQAVALEAAEPALAETIRAFRDDELDHKHIAETQGAMEAPGYGLLKAIIQAGCRAAIKFSEKI